MRELARSILEDLKNGRISKAQAAARLRQLGELSRSTKLSGQESSSEKDEPDIFNNLKDSRRAITGSGLTTQSKFGLAELAQSLSQLLMLNADEIDVDKKFIELGLDSILGIEWIKKINHRYDLDLKASSLYDYPNLQAFYEFIEGEIGTKNAEKLKANDKKTAFAKESTQLTVGVAISLNDIESISVKGFSPRGIRNPITLTPLPVVSESTGSEHVILSSDSDEDQLKINTENVVSDLRCESSMHQENALKKRTDNLRRILTKTFSECLLISEQSVDEDKEFIEMGMDSILGVEWMKTLEKELGLSLSATILYDAPTISRFALYLVSHHANTLFSESASITDNLDRVAPAAAEFGISFYDTPQKVAIPHRAISANSAGIAIIGISGRYPDAESLDEYWDNLISAKDCVREVPSLRWDTNQYYDPLPSKNKVYCKWMGVLNGIEYFDPQFFKISPAEAEEMDPQQRLFLQEGYRAFEDAGYSAKQLSEKRCGIYLGIMNSEYCALAGISPALNPVASNYAIAAARIAYFLNLKGAAIAVDTACSSSLVASHLAVQALNCREIDMALVGGVTLYLTAESFLGMCAAGMLSKDGKCKTFDISANGFVPGEGVGAMVLKRLEDAERDKDPIHGIILGSGINQDGSTNGITAPSVKSQTDLEIEIYRKFAIDPSTISYVEAHGTGTKLGDPIELQALTAAFRQSTDKIGFCAIGSVKSNIGHTSAAAGIAGIHKVLLAMRHQQLVPTLHYNEINEHIEIASSPFYINTKLQPWPCLPHDVRRAAISSFGFSGTNAHLVLEDYSKSDIVDDDCEKSRELVFIFSARKKSVLDDLIVAMIRFLDRNPAVDLANLAYTLQTGRGEMAFRAAIAAASRDELQLKLQQYLSIDWEKGSPIAGIFYGKVTEKSLNEVLPNAQANISEILDVWVEQKNLSKLAEIWVKGVSLDGKNLFHGLSPRRIHAPAYPFARERCWWSNIIRHSTTPDQRHLTYSAATVAADTNREIIYIFKGNESFLQDHRVDGKLLLPAAAYFDLIISALNGGTVDAEYLQSKLIQFSQVKFLRPYVFPDNGIDISVVLTRLKDGGFSFKFLPPKDRGWPYCEGYVSVSASTDKNAEVLPTADLVLYKNGLGQDFLSGEKVYQLFESFGIDYGNSHRGIQSLWYGDNKVLSHIKLPATKINEKNFFLNPGLADSVLQTCIGLLQKTDAVGSRPIVPKSISHFEVFKPWSDEIWVLIRDFSKEKIELKTHSDRDVAIDIFDNEGNLIGAIKGIAFVEIDDLANPIAKERNVPILFTPQWNDSASAEAEDEIKEQEFLERLVIYVFPQEKSWPELKDIVVGLRGAHGLLVTSSEISLPGRLQQYSDQIYSEIHRKIKDKPQSNIFIQLIYSLNSSDSVVQSVGGILKTVELENSKFSCQTIGFDESCCSIQWLVDKIQENFRHPADKDVLYTEGKRKVKRWVEISTPQHAVELGKDFALRQGGVYIITGGATGIGLLFAKAIANQVDTANLILCGRSPGERVSQTLKAENLPASINYYSVDVTNKESVINLISAVKKKFGKVNGIFHSAGIIHDNVISKKSWSEFASVLAPKVDGLVNLDEASQDENLDFFVGFSSIAGALGNVGQADYCTANAFIDFYMNYRSELVEKNLRSGLSLSINWPLWDAGGMRVHDENIKNIKDRFGLEALNTEEGIAAFFDAMAIRKNHIMVLKGDRQGIGKLLLRPQNKKNISSIPKIHNAVDIARKRVELVREVEIILSRMISIQLKLSIDEVESKIELSEFGYDSISLTELANNLNNLFDLELTPAQFFEYTTIERIATYLVETHNSKFSHLATNTTNADIENIQSEISAKQSELPASIQEVKELAEEVPSAVVPAIAVVGISCCFPMASDLNQFWENLLAGRDCITEIPETRWDWEEFWGDPASEANKTNVKWGGFVDEVEEFDPLFFAIAPREAEFMDPQPSLLRTYIWKLIEDAGYSSSSLSGTDTAIFVGTANSGYGELITRLNIPIEGYSATASAASVGPNRMSYFLNLHGPSEPIDTACSSALVAVQRGTDLLQSNQCQMAIVGGVNTLVSPSLYISFNKAGMLASDGRCKPFSAQANGYARGEGIGLLMLKRLSDARQAGDHIYGLIRSAAVNHGGRANSLTAPNPKAQADVIKKALRICAVDPATITYVETHGTGTALGDPIEINALKAAFKHQPAPENINHALITSATCGLGSVKSNIGHLELAAGIAGVIKVLLQFKHKTIVKTLHCAETNPYIKLDDSRFYIAKENREWKRLLDSAKREIPRRAGVSSFGFGGVNAHLILEEYIDEQCHSGSNFSPDNRVVVPLSAKTSILLRERAKALLESLSKFDERDLPNIAYTLQVGRDGMEERFGVVVDSLQKLKSSLEEFVQGNLNIDNSRRGSASRRSDILKDLIDEENISLIVNKWFKEKNYLKIVELWCEGASIDWIGLYERRGNRVALPSYPFSKERCWLSPLSKNSKKINQIKTRGDHLVQKMEPSKNGGNTYFSVLSGEEFFLSNHVINGKKVLPGVLYLEMAISALKQQSLNARCHDICLTNIAWTKPFRMEKKSQVINIDLSIKSNKGTGFVIYTGKNGGENIYCTGFGELINPCPRSLMDLEKLKNDCSLRTLEKENCYAYFRSKGIEYGVAHQGIQKIFIGKDQSLAQLLLPECLDNSFSDYQLHPSLIDSVMQSVVGLLIGRESISTSPLVPYSLGSVRVYGHGAERMWAWVRNASSQALAQSDHPSGRRDFDIDVCDDDGNIFIKIENAVFRELKNNHLTKVADSDNSKLIFYKSAWEKSSSIEKGSTTYKAVDNAERRILILGCEMADQEENLSKELKKAMPHATYIGLKLEDNSIESGFSLNPLSKLFQAYALRIYQEIGKLLDDRKSKEALIQVILPNEKIATVLSGLTAILRTANKEHLNLVGQFLIFNEQMEPREIVEKLSMEASAPEYKEILYNQEGRWLKEWNAFIPGRLPAPIPWRENGTYLITGGLGGLGHIFAKDISEKLAGVKLILVGRSLPDGQAEHDLAQLSALGAKVAYYTVDVGHRPSLETLMHHIQSEYGYLTGILHTAGVTLDRVMLEKSEEEIVRVFAPKLDGTVHLDELSRNMPLDFFVVFSSVAAVFGNPGQSDYAAANAFMDNYIAYRANLAEAGLRSGKSLSVNWPYWEKGGMVLSGDKQKLMTDELGLLPLPSSEGLAAFYQAIFCENTRVMPLLVVPGAIHTRLFERERFLAANRESKKSIETPHLWKSEPGSIEKNIGGFSRNFLKKLFSATIHLAEDRIDINAPLEKYGFDSLMVLGMLSKLENIFGAIPKTLFFEYRNISGMAEYFEKNHSEKLAKLLDAELGDKASERTIDIAISKPISSNIENFQHDMPVWSSEGEERKSANDIAIVGISGRYAKSDNIDEFWINLKHAVDCVTEIPQDRWSADLFYDEGRDKIGKMFSKWGGFIDGVADFDSLFFNISPHEAAILDPQERLFLECVYHVLEDAGYNGSTLNQQGSVGVYVGSMYSEYQLYSFPDGGSTHALSGYSSSIANRVSYFFDFRGPSLAVDSMCSSSLTTLHMACHSIQHGDCVAAIAGGVNTSIHPSKYLLLSQGGFLSSKGRCESFGKGGNGYVPGEGVGAVLLKKLDRAIEAKDQIYGVIKGSAISHGGRTNGYTVPDPNAQASVISAAWNDAGMQPYVASYVEAHGTGTSLGDPVEIAGLTKVFCGETNNFANEWKGRRCPIGSVKSNIGHCEGAAGIAAVTKVLLQMRHKKLVPSLHSKTLNPFVDFGSGPFVVQQALADWPCPEIEIGDTRVRCPRVAGISSFGAGGSNAHLVIEEYVDTVTAADELVAEDKNPVLIPLSARDEEKLREVVKRLLKRLTEIDSDVVSPFTDADLAGIGYTLQIGRERMEARLGISATSLTELVEKLTRYLDGAYEDDALHVGHWRPNENNFDVFGNDLYDQYRRGNFSQILKAWVSGNVIDWNQLYLKKQPKRVRLPVYPFKRIKHWAPPENAFSLHAGLEQKIDVSASKQLFDRLLDDLYEGRINNKSALDEMQDFIPDLDMRS